jgi:saccharopine dehydrogenase (NAD+, L-lysine-forming)
MRQRGAALELMDSGAWSGAGVLGPEALPARPFLDLLTDYGSPWACEERIPAATAKNTANALNT